MRGTLHHIEIYVQDLQTTKSFWGWLLDELGYYIYQEWSQGISYRLGDTYLDFVQVSEKYSTYPYHRCHAGLNHLAFHGESQEFVDQLTIKLQTKGIPILYSDRHPYAGGPDFYAVFFEDPNRIKVEVVAN
jgi:catechol 2,3-dioxygenase-like lactoylglutathione lyase family enzyme